MKKEIRTAVFDNQLNIEAYRFKGIVQPFPNHFHEYYVIGYIEKGKRCLSCKNKNYNIEKGNVILFNPGDNHTCVQNDTETFDYRGFNISKSIMLDLTKEVTGKNELPVFLKNVISDNEIIYYLKPLHKSIMNNISDFSKEENLLLMISFLIQNYEQKFENRIPDCQKEINKACEFIKQHFNERITLEQICQYTGLSKSTLLRAFTKSKGITPYRYLETIRISEAKTLLQKGIQPLEVAILTGFSDQSHFTNYFSSFIGLTPGAYREIFLTNKGGNQNGK